MPTAELKSNKIVAALKAAAAKDVDVDGALDQLTDLVQANPRKALVSIKTEIGTCMDGSPLLVGWDICGSCKQHISNCECTNGPVCPEYIQHWAQAHATKYGSVKDAVKLTGAAQPPTVVGSPENSKVPFSPEATSDSEDSAIPPGAEELPDAQCRGCGMDVTSETGDPNDDGSWSCLACQAAGQ